MNQKLFDRINEIVGKENVYQQEPLKKHTTFRIGGPAELFVTPHTSEEVAETLKACKGAGENWYLMGNGSNLLVSDKGFDGVVIQLFKNFNTISIEGEVLTAQAGALNTVIAKRLLDESLTGYEFASGIPGTIGGAVVMNAGAYGGEMKDVLLEVTVLDENFKKMTIPVSKLELGYRTSLIAKKGYVVLEAKMQFCKGSQEKIKARMEELKEKRVSKQPLEYPSAGSTFKRPEGYFAGKLIMDSGLRGFTVGGAQVSEKHCGFVINKGDATAQDVITLMKEVRRIVEEKYGVSLEAEVKLLGDF
ncbi:MAG: UDP-N-acetylmuramate dehydrogenase [Muricoprocola sp.]